MGKTWNIKGYVCLAVCGLLVSSFGWAADEVEIATESYVVVQDEDGNTIYEGAGDGDIDISGILSSVDKAVSSDKQSGGSKLQEQIAQQIKQHMSKMHEQKMDNIKKQLGVTDEEWMIIQPRLEKVMALSWHTHGMAPGQTQLKTGNPQETVKDAMKDLQETIDKESPSTAEIKAKLTALRGAREKRKQQLFNAQQKLKEVLTVKQEAILVMNSLLE